MSVIYTLEIGYSTGALLVLIAAILGYAIGVKK